MVEETVYVEWDRNAYCDGWHRLGSYAREMPRSSREEEEEETGESDEKL